ncbi:DNA cytosine methyltransferase [Saccharothrix lopnurensis]|uniref:DNA cytosine methyltransferase n=1 Tax=Saccharothrix lopnurensis TaxID=1670621 RepID=A0ABW1P7M7_9PSEU
MGSLCTGYGGLDLGVLTAFGGGRIAWAADPDPHIEQILAARMPGVANLGDLRHIDWAAVEPVDVLTAGFPCQDISAAGKRMGIEKGIRSGLWADIVAGLRLLRPALLVLENVAALRWRGGGLHRVLGDLAEAGYDAAWRSVRAADVGAAHRRERIFLLAWPHLPRTGWADAYATDTGRARRLVELARRRRAGRTAAAGEGPAAAHTQGVGHRDSGSQGGDGIPAATVTAGAPTGGTRGAAADTAGHGRHEGLPRATGLQGRPDAALGGHPTAHPDRGPTGRSLPAAAPEPGDTTTDRSIAAPSPQPVNWGAYEAAIRRWETLLGRPAPYPTQPGNHGRPVLAPAFVEHLMGLPPGWVTDLPLPRTAQLRALGNGVLPQQAAHAVTLLIDDLAELLDVDTWRGTEQERTAA